jgi:pimeloyl-ACP methyl ester carboxylesterase
VSTERTPRHALQVPIDIGAGPLLVLLPGFALPPAVYRDTAELLAAHFRVVVPELYRVTGGWSDGRIVERLLHTIDRLGSERVTMIAHSFAGGVQLDFATQFSPRVEELVFCDTLAISREWRLAREAARAPFRLLRMATPEVALEFGATLMSHPVDVAQAAWWGFTSGRTDDAERIASDGIPTHVLWANRDSILSQKDGRAFAQKLGASFDVVREPNGGPIDHDWMYRHPTLFAEHVEALNLRAQT